MTKRDWKTWPKRFRGAIEGTSGAVSIVGGLTAIVGSLVFTGPMAVVIGAIGIGGGVVTAALMAIPPLQKNAQDLLNRPISLSELLEIQPPPLRIAVVGASQSGKSTFLSTVLHKTHSNVRTNGITAELFPLSTNPISYAAVIDGDGQAYYQQFEVANQAHFLVIIVDHNQAADENSRVISRFKDHDSFLAQIERFILANKKIPRIHLILNKRDLWEGHFDAPEIISWFKTHEDHWSKTNSLTNQFTSDFHTNNNTADTAKVMNKIRYFYNNWKP